MFLRLDWSRKVQSSLVELFKALCIGELHFPLFEKHNNVVELHQDRMSTMGAEKDGMCATVHGSIPLWSICRYFCLYFCTLLLETVFGAHQ